MRANPSLHLRLDECMQHARCPGAGTLFIAVANVDGNSRPYSYASDIIVTSSSIPRQPPKPQHFRGHNCRSPGNGQARWQCSASVCHTTQLSVSVTQPNADRLRLTAPFLQSQPLDTENFFSYPWALARSCPTLSPTFHQEIFFGTSCTGTMSRPPN